MPSEEWDWPPSRTGRDRVFDAKSRVVEERFIRPRGNDRKPKGPLDRVADVFLSFVLTLFKAAAGVVLACVFMGAMWLMTAIISP